MHLDLLHIVVCPACGASLSLAPGAIHEGEHVTDVAVRYAGVANESIYARETRP